MYIYSLCEIAQMVEFNAHGLVTFFQTLKTVSHAIAKYGKEYSAKAVKFLIKTYRSLQRWLVKTFRAYFIRKDLSQEELESQLKVLRLVARVGVGFVLVNFCRIIYRVWFR